MADFEFDLRSPYPDVIVDTMRRAVVESIDELGDHAAGIDDSYFLTDLLFSLLDSALAASSDAVAERDQLRADLDALTARVAALEPPPVVADPLPPPP